MSAPRPSADPRLGPGAGALVLFALALPAAGLAAADPPLRLSAQVDSLQRGLFCATDGGGRMEAPDTEFGWIHVPAEPVAMRAPGAVAPAVLGIGFGVDYTLSGADPVLVRHVVEHPPMPPSGRVSQSWESWVLGGVPEVVFFQFDIAEELLPGRWTFAAQAGDSEVFHAAFDVVPPERAPHLAGLCAGGDLLAVSR
jgi:hypothetical protein